MVVWDCLKELGCDMEGVKERFLHDEDFYWECYDKFVNDGEMEEFGQILAADNAQDAFVAAHSLKGTLGNLGLTPLYEIITTIVEPLREGKISGVVADYEKLMEKWKVFKDIHRG